MTDIEKMIRLLSFVNPNDIEDCISNCVENSMESVHKDYNEKLKKALRRCDILFIKNMQKNNFSMEDIKKATNFTQKEIDILLKAS